MIEANFVTLQEAIDGCDSSGSTIKVLRNVTDASSQIQNTKDITINLAGYTVNTTKKIVNKGKIKIKESAGIINNTTGVCVENEGTFQLGEWSGEWNDSDNEPKEYPSIRGKTVGIQNKDKDDSVFIYYDGQVSGQESIRGETKTYTTPLPYLTVVDRVDDIDTGTENEVARLAYISEPVARIYNFYFQAIDTALRIC